MILHEDATTSHLIYSPTWEIEDFPSCCTCDVVLRLEAEYTTQAQRKVQQKSLINAEFGIDQIEDNEISFHRLIRRTYADEALAISRDTAFAGVLSNMLSNPHQLFLGTDNISRPARGDVHKGPFNTRLFFPWLSRNKLATVRRGLTRSQTPVTCWSALLNLRAARRYVQTKHAAYIEQYNKFASQLPNDSRRSLTGYHPW